MKIDRSNYEIWLIDWIDGNLTEIQVEQLRLFLNENPDLKKESEDLFTFSVKPQGITFTGKIKLKKTTSDINETQFDFLSVGHLENDLTASQEYELNDIIKNDSERRKRFDIIQKTKLAPEKISYPYKNKLVKRTLTQQIIRYSVIGFSTAATVALLITSYLILPHNLTDTSRDGSLSVSALATDVLAPDAPTPEIPANNRKSIPIIIPDTRRDGSLSVSTPITNSFAPDIPSGRSQIVPSNIDDTIVYRAQSVPEKIVITIFKPTIDLKTITFSNTLIASQPIPVNPASDEDRSNVGRFLAKNFRRAFMKEKSPADNPLKAYEIAEVGVNGLNKLFGWEMALEKNSNENGELNSVYFSSKILKFNAPVKKTEAFQ